MQEESVGPGGTWEGGEPVVAYGELAGECTDYRDLLGGQAGHDRIQVVQHIGRVLRDGLVGVVVDESRHCQVRWVGARVAAGVVLWRPGDRCGCELLQDVAELVWWVDRHDEWRPWADGEGGTIVRIGLPLRPADRCPAVR